MVLKKQLAAVQIQAVTSSPEDLAGLEKELAVPGEAVRKLKSAKADKKDVNAAVAKLLGLKKQLAAVRSLEPAALVQTGVSVKKGGKKK